MTFVLHMYEYDFPGIFFLASVNFSLFSLWMCTDVAYMYSLICIVLFVCPCGEKEQAFFLFLFDHMVPLEYCKCST
jgi:hypothetical protein